MSKLEELIERLCPSGVIVYNLEDLVQSIKTGLNPRDNFKLNQSGSKYHYVTVKEFTGGKIIFDKNTDKIDAETKEVINSRSRLEIDDVLFSGIGTIGKVALVDVDTTNWDVSESVFLIKPKKELVMSKYLKYILETKNLKNQYLGKLVGSTLKGLRMSVLQKMRIPLPPLEVQQEIVRILDSFTELKVELEAELEARKKHYKYYKNKLLSNDNYTTSNLGDIGKVFMCKRILKEQTNTVMGVPFYKIGTFGKEPDAYINIELFEEFKSKYSYPRKGEILISASGTIGRIVEFNGEPSYFQDSNIVWISNDESLVLNKYLKHYYEIIKWNVSDGGTITRLYNDNIRSTKIMYPSLKEQELIVKILDTFDTLVNDLSQGLPAEIAARRRQYEYYRNKLLTFKEVSNESL
jgi:type I restriction enzyme S subunit